MAITYNDLYLNTRQRLRLAGIEAAQLEAQELVCYASDKTRQQLYTDMRLYAPNELVQRVDELTERRLTGEPLAYILGEWEFYGLPITVGPEVLIPRADTEVLAGRAIELIRDDPDCRVLDLCAGSGCVGLAIAAQLPKSRVVLTDWDDGAIRTCKQNVRRNRLSTQITCLKADALAAPTGLLWDFDLIVANPPYIPTGDLAGLDVSVRDFEPMIALDGGPDGLKFFRAIASKWKVGLRRRGWLCFEVGIGQAQAVAAILEDNGYLEICITPDTHGIDRVVVGRVS